MRPEKEERVPKHNNQGKKQGLWQLKPSHLNITLNFFLLQMFFMVPVSHFAIISTCDISSNDCFP